jgi:RNA recognition motif-containing protein
LFQIPKPLFYEHPNTVPSTATVHRSHSDSQLLFIPKQGKGISMSTKLYVGNLAFQTTSQELQELFAQAGTVESAAVVEDRDTGRSRGFGFVEMSTKEESAAAIDQFNGKEVNGRALKVNEAKPRENRSGGGGGRGGFGGNRSGGGGYGGGGNRGGGGGYGAKREPRW